MERVLFRKILVYTHAEYLAGVAPKPYLGANRTLIKPRVRVKMGRLVLSEVRAFKRDYLRAFARGDWYT